MLESRIEKPNSEGRRNYFPFNRDRLHLGHVCDWLLDQLYNVDRLLAALISLMVDT